MADHINQNTKAIRGAMKECTLQEAVEFCRNNGGQFWMKEYQSQKYHISDIAGHVVDHESNCLNLTCDHFKHTWIYEPPKSSFQKWNDNCLPMTLTDDSPKNTLQKGRREGWNANNEAVIELVKELIHKALPEYIIEQIEKLREP